MTLRTRLTIIHTGLFLVASLIVVGLIYLRNRASVLGLRDDVSALQTDPTQAFPTTPVSTVPGVPAQQAISDVVSGLLLQSLFTFLALGVVAGVLGWWLSGRVLRRVHTMTAQAQRISTANLHERMALAGPRDELRELADTFDGLLARLDHAFQVQGRFIANASHELRTPLTVTRTVIQVGLSSTEPDRVRRAKEELLRSNDRCIALINGLLQLARGEQELQQREPVRLDFLVTRALAEATSSELTIDVRTQPCEVLGDELLLGQVFRNLFDNAARYNVPDGTVSVEVTAEDGWGRLTVANTGPVVSADEVALLFEPFQRGSEHRTAGPEGVGLGLSIVRAVATAHGGQVSAQARPRGGLTVTIQIPRSPE